MKRLMIVLAMVGGVGCGESPNARTVEGGLCGCGTTAVHDEVLNVTCWTYTCGRSGGVSCIPDWQLKEPPR